MKCSYLVLYHAFLVPGTVTEEKEMVRALWEVGMIQARLVMAGLIIDTGGHS